MREGLQEVLDNAVMLRRLLMMTPEQRAAMEQERIRQGDMTTHADDVRAKLFAVLEQAQDLIRFLDQFESAPIIYTGEGGTADVLVMLERLMTLAKSTDLSR
ncbi:MAG TPA: hypothetical protein VGK74_25770 [Symbiobacteriaceae bacterium]